MMPELPWRFRSVRTKLVLLTGVSSVVGLVLLVLFVWAHYAAAGAFERAEDREEHAHVIDRLGWTASIYVEEIGDPVEQAAASGRAGIWGDENVAAMHDALQRARAESAATMGHLDAAGRTEEAELDDLLDDLVARAERVGVDPARYAAVQAFFHDRVSPVIQRRLATERGGAAEAITSARQLSRSIHGVGFAIAATVLLAVLAACLIAARRFAITVRRLQLHAERVAAGDLDHRVQAESDDELGALATSLDAMVSQLRQRRQSQLGFLAGVAHDLRNPLAALRTASEGLLRAETLPPEATVRRTIALVNRQVDRLSRMADDLFDAARVEAGELQMQRTACDLRDLAAEVGELYREASSAHTIQVRLPGETLLVDCDPTRIMQVLNNLISNAIKYSPAGGRIELAVARAGDTAVLTVADEGVGIEESAKKVIFEPFRRVSPSKDVLPGVGLGLAIARRIVIAHGGTIDVESTQGQGSRFRVVLPLARAPSVPQSPMRRAG